MAGQGTNHTKETQAIKPMRSSGGVTVKLKRWNLEVGILITGFVCAVFSPRQEAVLVSGGELRTWGC